MEQVERTSAETGNAFRVEKGALTEVFAKWMKAFEAQKPHRIEDKTAYVGFAAGLMLRTLIRIEPVDLISKPEGASEDNPAHFWPEGYLYVAFCLNIRGLVIERDYHGRQSVSEAHDDLQTWWSFRENVGENPELAIAFLDLFSGDKPNWNAPQIFQTERSREIMSGFFTPKIVK